MLAKKIHKYASAWNKNCSFALNSSTSHNSCVPHPLEPISIQSEIWSPVMSDRNSKFTREDHKIDYLYILLALFV